MKYKLLVVNNTKKKNRIRRSFVVSWIKTHSFSLVSVFVGVIVTGIILLAIIIWLLSQVVEFNFFS